MYTSIHLLYTGVISSFLFSILIMLLMAMGWWLWPWHGSGPPITEIHEYLVLQLIIFYILLYFDIIAI